MLRLRDGDSDGVSDELGEEDCELVDDCEGDRVPVRLVDVVNACVRDGVDDIDGDCVTVGEKVVLAVCVCDALIVKLGVRICVGLLEAF